MDKKKQNVAIVGPKGGVGKTIISANLAIALSKLGKKVIVVDLDLGASNLHTTFGLTAPKYTLDDYIFNKVSKLPDIVQNTDIDNLKIICGGDVPGIANLHYQKKVKLIRNLSTLESDFVLLDLGAGVSYNVVDFLIIAQNGLLVTTPDVNSLLNCYSFIKTLIFRRLTFYFRRAKCPELLELLEKAKQTDDYPDLKTMEGFLQEARKIDAALAEGAKKILWRFKPTVVVNRVRTANDAKAGETIRKLMRQYLSVESSVTMSIREDQAVSNALANLTPIMLKSPQSKFCKDIKEIAQALYNSEAGN